MSRLIHCDECGHNKPNYAKGLCRRCYNRQWQEEHREEANAHSRRWRREHPEEYAAYKRKWYREHIEEITARQHKYYEEYNEECKQRTHKHYKDNCEEINERRRQFTRANPGHNTEYIRRWRAKNPDKVFEYKNRRRVLKVRATIEPVNMTAIYERDGHMCLYCGTTHEKLTLDHIAALNNGGQHGEDNLLVACGRCNSSKQATPLEEWLQTQPRSLAWVI